MKFYKSTRLVLPHPDFTEEKYTPPNSEDSGRMFMVSGAIRKTVYSSQKGLEEAEEHLGMTTGVVTMAVSLDYIRELCFRSSQSNSRELLPALFPCLSTCD